MGREYTKNRELIVYIVMCDRNGKVERVICNTPLWPVMEGKNIRNLFTDPEGLDSLLQQDLSYGSSVCLSMNIKRNLSVCVTAVSKGNQVLLIIYKTGDNSQISRLIEMTLSALNVKKVTGQDVYGAGYYEIQKLNSQLVNYQRTLAKSNARLQTLLKETKEARSTIEVLECDTLTGLLTEAAFFSRAEVILHQHRDTRFDLVAADIEKFKAVNDAFGSETADRLLADLSTALLNTLSGELSLFTRARADTFFILVPFKENLLELLDKKIGLFLSGYPLTMRLRVRMGIYHIDNRNLPIARMCDRALMAADSIKRDYSRNTNVFDDSMHKKMILEQKITNIMEESLGQGDFIVYLQPKVEVKTGKVNGAEALVRWVHPEYGLIYPSDFIPVFESNGFIYSLDQYVWKKCCRMLRSWKRHKINTFPISVNVSRTDLYHEDLVQTLSDMVRDYGLKPEDLHLEITESAYVKDSEKFLSVIKKLKQKGFIIEMDDFGSGYSSLNTLSELPIDVMKLDLKFLRQTENNRRRQKVVEFVIRLADALKLQVIAEGVETREQAQMLKKLGCRHAQGYLYGRPMPEQEFIDYLSGKEL